MIIIEIKGTEAIIRKQEKLTSGTVGAAVHFLFDETWTAAEKTAVFSAAGVTRDVLNVQDDAVIPWETLMVAGVPLQIGIYGSFADGRKIPTVWAVTDPILPGADPSGDEGADPTLQVWEQVREEMEASVEKKLTEAKESGLFDGEDGGIFGRRGSGANAEIFNDYDTDYSETWGHIGNVASADFSHAEGERTQANGQGAHAEGGGAKANGKYSHAEGANTTADGNYSHTEGADTKAEGNFSHAEGHKAVASGESAHAEGINTIASGKGSHAEGLDTNAKGQGSHAEGVGTVASSNYQHTEGRHNVEDTEGKYAHIIGNGADGNNRSNAHTVDWSGNAWYAGSVSASDPVDPDELTTKEYVDTALDDKVDKVDGKGLSTEDFTTALKEKLDGVASGATSVGRNYAGGGEVFNHTSNVASGKYSHAEGHDCKATAQGSHAEGGQAEASGLQSHAEGYLTKATGLNAHAEGRNTQATAEGAHSEGGDTKANGIRSHAEGHGTVARGDYSHIQGKFNVEDTEGKYAHIVGNGTNANNRSNAHTVDWDGNAWYAGSVETTAIILRSPNGTRFSLGVNDDGTLVATAL